MKLYLALILIILILNSSFGEKSGLYDQEQNIQEENENENKKSGINNNNNENNDNNEKDKTDSENSTKMRHEYKLSFKKPYYYYNDTNIIPNWETFGDTIPSEDMIRLAPSIPNKSGSIWSKIPNSFKEWQIYLKLQISGRGIKGSQGLSLFYSKDILKTDQFYGSENIWNGLAIVFDSINIDESSKMPIMSVLYNDGNTVIKSKSDYNSIAKAICIGDFRNSPGPIHIRITYSGKTLKMEVDLSHHGKEFYDCAVVENIEIPTDYYFGMSAKTGNSHADDHDVVSFDFYELNPKPKERFERPLEAEIIEEEGEYKLDEGTMKHIKEIEKEIDDELEEFDEDMPDIPHSVNAFTVYESQYKILDIVNRILTHLKSGSPVMKNGNTGTNEGINQMSSEVQNTKTELEKTKEELKRVKDELSNASLEIKKLRQAFESNIQKIENKLHGSKDDFRGININMNSNNRKMQDELKQLHEENRQILELSNKSTNIWLIVIVTVILNAIVIYVITRVLPKNSEDMYNPNKIHHF